MSKNVNRRIVLQSFAALAAALTIPATRQLAHAEEGEKQNSKSERLRAKKE